MAQQNLVYSISDEQFLQIIQESQSILQIAKKLGYKKTGPSTYELIRKRMRELNCISEDLEYKARIEIKNKVYELSDEDFLELVQTSESKKQCLERLGYKKGTGKSFELLNRRIKEMNINIDHMNPYLGIQNQVKNTIIPIDIFFTKNNSHGSSIIRRKILRNNLIDYKCSCCGNEGFWCDQPLTLQIHHIDGDTSNNEISNLTFLCPNCHTQTENYGFKDRTK